MNQPENLAHLAADTVARQSYGKLLAYLTASTRDVAAAEDALSEAFAAALTTWPQGGVPQNPEGWLLTVARRRAVDTGRRAATVQGAAPQLGMMHEALLQAQSLAELPDHRLGLMFACAHPAVEVGIRAPLILQTVLGIDAKTMASAFLVQPTAMSKRLVRAKNKIQQAGIPLSVPEDLSERLKDVLDAIYVAFGEAWTDPEGTDVVRRNLGEESLFLAQLVAHLLPNEPEAVGLFALLLYLQARRSARRTAAGTYVPLAQQDIAQWDQAMISHAEACLAHAGTFKVIGRFQLEAAVQSAHVHRARTGKDNWDEVLRLYDTLQVCANSLVVAINRSLAYAHVHGAAAALQELQNVAQDARVQSYQPYWAAQAHLLMQVEDWQAAQHAFTMAIGLEKDEAVRQFLQGRLREASLRARS